MCEEMVVDIKEHYDPIADSLYIWIINDYEYLESIDLRECDTGFW